MHKSNASPARKQGMATTGNPPASRTRARLVCSGHTPTGTNILSEPLSDHAHARARARRRQFTEAEVAAWRERIFANGLEDPVKVAVEEAVRDFGRPEDFTIWAWYANRIGVNSFVELYFEQKSTMRESRLRSPAAAFHKRLKRFYAAMLEAEAAKRASKEGGAR